MPPLLGVIKNRDLFGEFFQQRSAQICFPPTLRRQRPIFEALLDKMTLNCFRMLGDSWGYVVGRQVYNYTR